jgi:hypothetical protein
MARNPRVVAAQDTGLHAMERMTGSHGPYKFLHLCKMFAPYRTTAGAGVQHYLIRDVTQGSANRNLPALHHQPHQDDYN